MTKTRKTRFLLASQLCNLLVMGLVCAALPPSALAQAAAEAAGTTSLSSSSALNAKHMEMPKILPPANSGTSPHIVASSNAASVETNRRMLETKAGKEAARLLIRSSPSQAQVWIEEKPVGTTPLLLIVPAGKYMIALRGTRQENAVQEIALLPREIRELTVKLELRYPTHVASH